MKPLSTITFAALMSVGAVTLISTNASAAIVCNEEGDCWHTQTEYQYKPEYGVTVHQNDWKWKEGEKRQWREHEGQGYWHGGSWMPF
jgi:hypothetical protein